MELKCGAVLKIRLYWSKLFGKLIKPKLRRVGKMKLARTASHCDGILHSSERNERIFTTDNDESIADEGEA